MKKKGSSPLARGLPVLVVAQVDNDGIIPARAGFTRPTWRPAAGPSDHPRSRGVYADIQHEFPDEEGSSPLARGLLQN